MDMMERRKKIDEMMEQTVATANWLLVCVEDKDFDGRASDVIVTPSALRSPFARVVSVGALCKSDVKKGDRVTYKEGVNIKEIEGYTSKKYLYVWEPNLCGRMPRAEEIEAAEKES